MPTIFISGAASGIGKAFVHAYAKRDAQNIIYALDRAFPKDTDNFLGLHRNQIIPVICDLTDPKAVSEHVESLRLDLDIVIHSAGVRGLVPSMPLSQYSDVAKSECLETMDAATLLQTFEINAVGTFLLMKALLPSLQNPARSGRQGEQQILPRVVVMGSRMGSIGHNTELGGAYAYRASKAALNAVVKSLSVDVPEAIWTIMHPGRVETGLVSIKEDDAMDVGEVVRRDLLPLIDVLQIQDSGRFIDRFGVDIPW